MAFNNEYADIFLSLACLISFYLFYRACINTQSVIPINWPVIGMIPTLIRHRNHLHDHGAVVLGAAGGTMWLRGPWFANIDMLYTCDPDNVNYMANKNFPNFPNGPKSREIFDIFGDAIFNSDGEIWELHQKTYRFFLLHPEIMKKFERIIWNKLEKGLMPVLRRFHEQGVQIDLQEMFQHFTFDNISQLILDNDPGTLSLDLPYNACEKAFPKMEQALLRRHLVPEKIWKLERRFQIGWEKTLTRARAEIDNYIFKCIAMKQEELNKKGKKPEEEELGLLTGFMAAYKDQPGSTGNPLVFIRDTLFNLMIAGKDTTSTALSWFFYLVASNPSAENKIVEEIHANLDHMEEVAGDGVNTWKVFSAKDELSKFVYLHAALSETLRLYPPLALHHKSPVQDDVLPSGHSVPKGSKIILSYYSMGRMETVWGKDRLEFKPERWINEQGKIKHVPSYKFTAFHTGPKACVGKEMTMMQMKIAAITVLSVYHVELVKGHVVAPSGSVVIQMKNGLKVKLTKREVGSNK